MAPSPGTYMDADASGSMPPPSNDGFITPKPKRRGRPPKKQKNEDDSSTFTTDTENQFSALSDNDYGDSTSTVNIIGRSKWSPRRKLAAAKAAKTTATKKKPPLPIVASEFNKIMKK